MTLTDYQKNNYLYLDEKTLTSVYSVLADAIEATIFLSDTEGNILICTDTDLFVTGQNTVPESILKQTVNGSYQETGRLGGAYKSKNYTVAQPIGLPNGPITGFVFRQQPECFFGPASQSVPAKLPDDGRHRFYCHLFCDGSYGKAAAGHAGCDPELFPGGLYGTDTGQQQRRDRPAGQ